ncbi:hypothetical protein K7W03_11905 [Sphingobium sp. PNB]|uniref:hypothetical protein n=1 Tax=Sphingobium sp. PNB TaxID=863934 RepID=UPI001D0258F9|nr:hypothetical protein [Sphingobium sp. PNB]MCB4860298.1 hypothetical protein [Sphingobium sp. PNB]
MEGNKLAPSSRRHIRSKRSSPTTPECIGHDITHASALDVGAFQVADVFRPGMMVKRVDQINQPGKAMMPVMSEQGIGFDPDPLVDLAFDLLMDEPVGDQSEQGDDKA